MIEKILDKYYMKKLKLLIKQYMLQYLLDYRFVNKKNTIDLEIKKVSYNNSMYKNIYSISKDKAIFYITDYKEMQKSLNRVINSYKGKLND